MTPDPLAEAIEAMLGALGAPADDPELDRTPQRVARLWRTNLLVGQGQDPLEALAERIPAPDDGVITITGLPFHSICPHHLLPTFGVVHLAYAPGPYIVGFGALERLVRICTRRLVLQETLTAQLADTLMTALEARGAACAIEATHLCLTLQGQEPRGARIDTRITRGCLTGRADILPPVRG